MKKVTVIGGGVLGSQIAFQTAYSGFDVTIYLISKEATKSCKEKIEKLKDTYLEAIKKMDEIDKGNKHDSIDWCLGISGNNKFNKQKCTDKVKNAFKNIKYEMNVEKALKGADLVIESMTEDLEKKKKLYTKIKPILDKKTIVVSNSSTILPSKMAKSTGREDKFLSLHFANSIWKMNTAEVMSHSKTSEESFNAVLNFAEKINMIVLPLRKEKSGYLLNSMLIPLLFSGLDLYVNGISDPKSIDIAWKKGTGSPKGPFEIIDTIGVTTAHNVVKMYLKVPKIIAPYNFKAMHKLLDKMEKENKLGKSTGEGFYKYK